MAMCMLFFVMNCLSCSCLVLIPSMLYCSMFMLCVFFLVAGVRTAFGGVGGGCWFGVCGCWGLVGGVGVGLEVDGCGDCGGVA